MMPIIRPLRTGPTAFVLSVLFLSVTALLTLFSCKKTDPAELERLAKARDAKARRDAITAFVSGLSDEQKISQLFLVNVEGNESFSPVEKTGALYGKKDEGTPLVPGGCLLFSYNISDSAQKIRSYTDSIRRFYADNDMVPPYIAIDQEGGYVNRLRGVTSNLVSQKKVTEWFTAEQAHGLYAAQAKQLRALGLQMNLAPVVEVETDGNREFLNTRSFGTLEKVIAYGKEAISAYEENGVAAVLKHFPGNNNTDPHTGLPRIDLASPETAQSLVAPFSALSPLSSALLMSHIVARFSGNPPESASHSYEPSLPDQTRMPACFSSYWVNSARSFLSPADSLRDDFGTLIFSDDIFMGALSDNGYPPDIAVVSAIDAGVNCIMLSEKVFGEVAGVLLLKSKVTDTLSQTEQKKAASLSAKINESVARVTAFKIKAGLLQFVPVPNEKGEIDQENPVYTVVRASELPPFDESAYKSAYDEGMSFYR